MSFHLVDGFIKFATFFVPAVLLALADRPPSPKPPVSGTAAAGTTRPD